MNIFKKLEMIWAMITGKPLSMEKTSINPKSSSPLATIIEFQEEDRLPLIRKRLRDLLILREGEVRDGAYHVVYKDSEGKPTVGWGHLVLPEDNLKVGDRITNNRAEKFFSKDTKLALEAAFRQAKDLGHYENDDFVVSLASVNYQLGTGWARVFRNTYAHIKAKNYNQAIKNLRRSKWNKQTPTRVNDFIDALAKL